MLVQRRVRLFDWYKCVQLLCAEWDLGSTCSKSSKMVCGWLYWFEVLADSDRLLLVTQGTRVAGMVGYGGFTPKVKRKLYRCLSKVIRESFLIKDKVGMNSYVKMYEDDLSILHDFDCELTIIITRHNCRGIGLGSNLLRSVKEVSKAAGFKSMRIKTDDSCSVEFYQYTNCELVYTDVVETSGETGKPEQRYVYKLALV